MRQLLDQAVGGVAELADMEIVELRIILRAGTHRGPAQRHRAAGRVGAGADIVHLLALDVHAADEHRVRPCEIG